MNFEDIGIKISPFETFARLSKKFDDIYILESILGPEKLSEFSYIGFNPSLKITLDNNTIRISKDDKENITDVSNSYDLFSNLREILKENYVDNDFNRLVGGLVGFISYDIVRCWEDISDNYTKRTYADFQFGLFNEGIIFDHERNKSYYYYSGQNNLEEILELLNLQREIGTIDYTEPTSNIDKEKFENNVDVAKEYIRSGDIFQVVLSRKYEFEITGDLLSIYKALRTINPSPYMYYYKTKNVNIIGSSPEMLVRVTGNQIETFPIAGTRPRDDDEERNKQLTDELLSDEKERAEHVMLVDLARNDVGQIARFGSVKVPEFMQVHQFSHVQHIVSKVIGELKKDKDCFDAIRAIFPAGTVSGAPKIRAMEIIQELEGESRGPYAGALGYFSKNMCADFAITIRTLVVKGNDAYIQAGAGIVADSIPEREWFETEQKASALIAALEMAKKGVSIK
ncbi:MAG: anthranilate synthase component I [Nitrososphaerales archaeon]|nr:anthranilate synthase component I [Nitrososphaerales archaeon]